MPLSATAPGATAPRHRAIHSRRGWQASGRFISKPRSEVFASTQETLRSRNNICGARSQRSIPAPCAVLPRISQRSRQRPPMTAIGRSLPRDGPSIWKDPGRKCCGLLRLSRSKRRGHSGYSPSRRAFSLLPESEASAVGSGLSLGCRLSDADRGAFAGAGRNRGVNLVSQLHQVGRLRARASANRTNANVAHCRSILRRGGRMRMHWP